MVPIKLIFSEVALVSCFLRGTLWPCQSVSKYAQRKTGLENDMTNMLMDTRETRPATET